jgi:hypothetical protein
MDSHTFDGHNETNPDDTDFEYITAILESFTDLKTTQLQENQKINQNFGARNFHNDAAPRTCKARHATPSKFNYKSILKRQCHQISVMIQPLNLTPATVN